MGADRNNYDGTNEEWDAEPAEGGAVNDFDLPPSRLLDREEKGARALGGGRINGWTLGARARTRHVHIQSPEGNCVAPVAIPSGGTFYDFGVATPSAILAHLRAHALFQTARGVMSI